MKRGSEEALVHPQYTFSLRAFDSNQRSVHLICDFTPVQCRKTFKLIRTHPTYHPELDFPFQTDADKNTCSVKLIADDKPSKNVILVARPKTLFCQICKQNFEDYLKHSKHPLHLKRMKQSNEKYDVNSLKDVLERCDKRSRTVTWKRTIDRQQESQQMLTLKSQLSIDYSEMTSISSKKKIVMTRNGQMQTITTQTNTFNGSNSPAKPLHKAFNIKINNDL